MTMTAAVKYTVEEYLTLENQALEKSEYIEGVIYPMPGVSHHHSLILTALIWLLYPQMKRRGEVHAQDVRLKIVDIDAYLYPDIAIVLGAGEIERRGGYHLLNPTVVIEILSPATENHDRERKFALYQRIPWLQEYILVAQDKVRIEHYKRQENGGWQRQPDRIYEDPQDSMILESVGCTLVIGDIYDDVNWESA